MRFRIFKLPESGDKMDLSFLGIAAYPITVFTQADKAAYLRNPEDIDDGIRELVDAINNSDDNPGVSAALVKTDGTTTIMLTSDTTGEQSGFSVSVSGNTDLATAESSSEQQITQAQMHSIKITSIFS